MVRSVGKVVCTEAAAEDTQVHRDPDEAKREKDAGDVGSGSPKQVFANGF